MTAERLAVAEFLEVVEPACDAFVSIGVIGIKRNGRATVDAAVHLFRVDDVLELAVDDARFLGAVRIDEITASVGRIAGTLGIAVAQRRLERRKRGDGAGVAFELARAFVVGRLDGGFDSSERFLVILRDDEAHRIFRCAAVDALRLENADIAPARVGTRDYLCVRGHDSFPPI